MFITIIYTLLIFILGLNTNMRDMKARKIYLIVSGIILVFISGLRSYYFGTGDTLHYLAMFDEDVKMSFQQIYNSELKDPFYHLFSKALSIVFGNNFSSILTVFAIMFIMAYGKLVYRESTNLLLSFIIFFAMGYFYFSMNGVRQGLAISFIMLSYFPLKEKRFFNFLLLVLIASCFHLTALVFLIAYPFCQLGINLKTAFLYLSLIIIMLLYGDSFIYGLASEMSVYDDRFAGYAVSEKSLTYMGFIQLCLYLILVLGNLKRFRKQDPDASILIILLILAMIFQIFAVFIAEMFRVAIYFSSFLVILVPRLLSTYPTRSRKILTCVLSILLLVYFYMYPYKLAYDFFWND